MSLEIVRNDILKNDSPSKIFSSLLEDVQRFIEERYIDELPDDEYCEACGDSQESFEPPCFGAIIPEDEDVIPQFLELEKKRSLEDLLAEVDETFAEALFRFIDVKGKTDPEVYKRAHVDRKLFSKIRNNPAYKPSKSTALALAVALELNLDETKDLIGRAGYALSHSSKSDIIVEYFIQHGEFDIITINETLFAFEQPLLGC